MKKIKESTVKWVTYILIGLLVVGGLYAYKELFPEEWNKNPVKRTLVEWKSWVGEKVNSLVSSAGETLTSSMIQEEKSINAKDTNQLAYDTLRHYYPILQGETLKMAYSIGNKSDITLVIKEVQTSCGCVILRDELPLFILPQDTGYVHVDFITIKNSGYVSHYIQCFGNFCNTTDSINTGSSTHPQWDKYIELRFDTHVVPPADYAHDYEEIWHKQSVIDGTIRDFVDGKTSQKNYWVDSDTVQKKK